MTIYMNGIYDSGYFDTRGFNKITVVTYYGGSNSVSGKRFTMGGINRQQGSVIDVSSLDKINYEIFNGHSNYDWYKLQLLFE